MANSVFIDGHSIYINLPPDVSLAVVISVIERALVKRGARVASVLSDGKDIFNANDFCQPWAAFEGIECKSTKIQKYLKKAVVTLAIGDKHCEMSRISHPTMQAYADRIGSEFVVINEIRLRMRSLLLEKWQMYDLLFEYDRLLFLDTDILVAPHCPDLFDIVPIERVGGLVESDYIDRKPWILAIQDQLGRIGWKDGYINSGVGVYSYIHKPIFDKTLPYVIPGDQHTYNYRIKQIGFHVHPLQKEFNYMELCGSDRLKSYILHYAGSGFTGIPCAERERLFSAKVSLMKKDAEGLRRVAEGLT